MAEYLDREAISEEIRKYYYKNPPNFSYGEGFDRGLDRAQRAILDAPAAERRITMEIRRCGNSWVCYDGECDKCKASKITYTDRTQPQKGEQLWINAQE